MRRPRIRSLAGGAAGLAAGVIGGVALTSVSAAGPTPQASAPAIIEAAHVPPALTLPGERVRLRYSLVCAPRDDGRPCDGSGSVYARAGRTGAFTTYALQRGDDSLDGRYYLDLPPAVSDAADGFSYYAVLRDNATGATTSVPAGGAAAPQESVSLRNPATVRLGKHEFGRTRDPDARAAEAPWGSGPQNVGLAGTRELGFMGPSSFDVEPDGSVDVLDSVNARVLRWAAGRRETIPLPEELPLADLAFAPDGGFDVLDVQGVLTRYGQDGNRRWAQRLADRTWAKLAHGRSGPLVLAEPSEQWLPATDDGVPLTVRDQARAARSSKPVANGNDVVVDRVGAAELRVAELRNGVPRRSWRILSETALGEVQLAESHGSRLVVVTHPYIEGQDEFEVLVLDARGLAERFAVASGSFTETAPLARFRLARGALYRLRTTASGAVVDRFDLEVSQ